MISIRDSLVIRHKFQLRFIPKLWHTLCVLESRDFRRYDVITLICEILSSDVGSRISNTRVMTS